MQPNSKYLEIFPKNSDFCVKVCSGALNPFVGEGFSIRLMNLIIVVRNRDITVMSNVMCNDAKFAYFQFRFQFTVFFIIFICISCYGDTGKCIDSKIVS